MLLISQSIRSWLTREPTKLAKRCWRFLKIQAKLSWCSLWFSWGNWSRTPSPFHFKTIMIKNNKWDFTWNTNFLEIHSSHSSISWTEYNKRKGWDHEENKPETLLRIVHVDASISCYWRTTYIPKSNFNLLLEKRRRKKKRFAKTQQLTILYVSEGFRKTRRLKWAI